MAKVDRASLENPTGVVDDNAKAAAAQEERQPREAGVFILADFQRLVIVPDRISGWTSKAGIPRPWAIVSASTVGEPSSKLITPFGVDAIVRLRLQRRIQYTSMIAGLRLERRDAGDIVTPLQNRMSVSYALERLSAR